MWDLLRVWANDHNGLITVAIAVVGGLFAWARVDRARLDAELEDPRSHADLIAGWRQGWHGAYLNGVRRVATFADTLYGPHLLSRQAFSRCLQLAFLYPIFAALLAWVLVNQHSPAGLELFVDDPLWGRRLGRAGLLVGSLTLAVLIILRAERFAGWVVDRTFGGLDTDTPRTGFLPKAVRGVIEVGAFAGAFAGAVAGAFAGAFAVAVAGAFAVAVAVAVAGAVAGAVAVAVAGAVAGAVAVAVAVILFTDTPEVGYVFLFFYALLPILNAIADFVSIAITRRFLTGYTGAPNALPSLPGILARALLDLLLALLCLGTLLWALYASLTLWGTLSPATQPLSPTTYLAEITANPWNGIALYFMIATTLLPTFLHMIAGFGAMFTHRGRMLSAQADVLEASPTLSVTARGAMVRRVWWAKTLGMACAAVPVLAVFALFIVPLYWLLF